MEQNIKIMEKLHIDNYPELLQWCKNNLEADKYQVWKHNITIYCKDLEEKNNFIDQTNEVRTPEHKL